MAAAVEIIIALSALTRAAVNIGIDFRRFNQLQAQATAEGRMLTKEEIDELAQTARDAVTEAREVAAALEAQRLAHEAIGKPG